MCCLWWGSHWMFWSHRDNRLATIGITGYTLVALVLRSSLLRVYDLGRVFRVFVYLLKWYLEHEDFKRNATNSYVFVSQVGRLSVVIIGDCLPQLLWRIWRVACNWQLTGAVVIFEEFWWNFLRSSLYIMPWSTPYHLWPSPLDPQISQIGTTVNTKPKRVDPILSFRMRDFSWKLGSVCFNVLLPTARLIYLYIKAPLSPMIMVQWIMAGFVFW